MTDKVQKIREEVERLKESGCASPIVICDTLLVFIDSLQEEPKDKCNGCNNVKGCITCVDRSEWAHYEHVSEELEAEKQFKAGDVVMYVSRHPAYSGLYLLGNPNDLSIGYSNANEPYQIALRNCTITSENERKQFMRELNSNGYKWNDQTLRVEKIESVIEGLEEEIDNYVKRNGYDGLDSIEEVKYIANHFAEWGKNQAKVEIQAQSMALAHGCPKENTSNELKVAADNALESISDKYDIISVGSCLEMFRLGAEWQKEREESV